MDDMDEDFGEELSLENVSRAYMFTSGDVETWRCGVAAHLIFSSPGRRP